MLQSGKTGSSLISVGASLYDADEKLEILCFWIRSLYNKVGYLKASVLVVLKTAGLLGEIAIVLYNTK